MKCVTYPFRERRGSEHASDTPPGQRSGLSRNPLLGHAFPGGTMLAPLVRHAVCRGTQGGMPGIAGRTDSAGSSLCRMSREILNRLLQRIGRRTGRPLGRLEEHIIRQALRGRCHIPLAPAGRSSATRRTGCTGCTARCTAFHMTCNHRGAPASPANRSRLRGPGEGLAIRARCRPRRHGRGTTIGQRTQRPCPQRRSL